MQEFKLLGDSPHRADSADAPDRLGFQPMAKGLCESLIKSIPSTPLCLGIQAPWGMGKSSLMQALEQQLRNREGKEKIQTVWFNAWKFEGKDVLEGVIKSALSSFGNNELRQFLKLGITKKIGRGLLTAIATKLGMKDVMEQIWDALSEDVEARNLFQEKLKQFMETRGYGQSNLLVVFIDDLDRCSSDHVLQLFEAMKLYLDAPGIAFVVGYDEGVISNAILAEKKYNERISPRQFLEKIIQIDFRIPFPDTPQIEALFDGFLVSSGTKETFEKINKTLIIERSKRNPRALKRFINKLVLTYQFEQPSSEDEETLDADLFVRVLLIQMYFSEFWDLFREPPDENPFIWVGLYREAMEALQGAGSIGVARTNEIVEQAFQKWNIPFPPNEDEERPIASYIDDLNNRVNTAYRNAANSNDFRAIVEGLTEEQTELMANRIQRRRKAGETSEQLNESLESESKRQALDFKGMRILWLDDNPEKNSAIIERIDQAGGRVKPFATPMELEYHLQELSAQKFHHPPEAIITDLFHENTKNQGFETVENLKTQNLIDEETSVIFFVTDLNEARRKQAKAMGCLITNTEFQLLEMLNSINLSRGLRPMAKTTAS